jgi:putative heme-binding domain-containing protein
MRSATLAFVLVLALLVPLGLSQAPPKPRPEAPNVVPTDPLPPEKERRAFTVPPGFEVQLVAAEPDIHKPLNLAFDARGRLWVTDTVEYPFPAPGTRKARDTVKVLEDFGPDGRARKVTTFADGLNIPIGVLPLPGSNPQDALVYSIPTIYRLRDSKGTGHADARTPLYERFGFRDTHGMTNSFTWGFDGWVYATHGFSNTSTVKGADKHAVTMNSGNTYRMRPDGSRAEQWTWGQVNPFGLTFDPLGNLYSADCHSQPIYQLLRGGYYPSFAKGHDGLGFAPEMFTGYKGSTAIAGIAYYAADLFPAEHHGTAFVGDVMTNQIIQFRLTWHGSTPRATVGTFLDSDDRWFRPVDIKLGPDGALYVADFYNRIIGHYEVPLDHPGRDRERGRIWRIAYTGKGHKCTPAPRQDWTKAPVAELVKDLRHPNLTVRFTAANQLAERGGADGEKAVRAALASGKDGDGSAWQRAHGLWVLQRRGALDDDTLRKAVTDGAALVRVHACRVLGERPKLSERQYDHLDACLGDADANVRRAAADALGRHPLPRNLDPLLKLRHAAPAADAHLLHVVRMALRDQLRSEDVWKVVRERRLKGRDAQAVADAAAGVPGPRAADFLLAHLRGGDFRRDQAARYAHHIARHGDKGSAAELLAFVKADQPSDLRHQAALLRALQRATQERGAPLGADVRAWAADLTGRLLSARHDDEVQQGIELVGILRLRGQEAKLASLASPGQPERLRAAALAALAALDVRRHARLLGSVLGDAAAPPGLRERAAVLLAQGNQDETRAQLLAALPEAPARLQQAIAAGLATSREGAEKLLDAVAAGKASARLLQEPTVAPRLSGQRIPGLKERLAKLTKGLPPADARMQALLAARRKGFLGAKTDAAQGAKVFEKSCAVCHQLGGKGSRIGPQLDGIGGRGLDRLLEDTLDPNRNVDQAFRLTTLTLKKGQVVSGLFLKEEGAVLVLADAQGKEVRVPAKEVEERRVSQASPMPANFAEQIPEADFYHLMAYLLAQRAAKPGNR